MPFIAPEELPVKEPRRGWRGRFFHSQHMTFVYYDIEPGSSVHLHQHPNEEVWHIIEGELTVTLDGAERTLRAGEAVVVPADVKHSANAVGPCRAIVVDYPVRTEVGGIDVWSGAGGRP
ncbi:MAG: cupin domain-containing protein [Candidatus Dormibacteraeota bacterium]|nr:cupin domain-containing protein [Candidatus Dormibacteraeota bacterium]